MHVKIKIEHIPVFIWATHNIYMLHELLRDQWNFICPEQLWRCCFFVPFVPCVVRAVFAWFAYSSFSSTKRLVYRVRYECRKPIVTFCFLRSIPSFISSNLHRVHDLLWIHRIGFERKHWENRGVKRKTAKCSNGIYPPITEAVMHVDYWPNCRGSQIVIIFR